jgi:hypothetical protein
LTYRHEKSQLIFESQVLVVLEDLKSQEDSIKSKNRSEKTLVVNPTSLLFFVLSWHAIFIRDFEHESCLYFILGQEMDNSVSSMPRRSPSLALPFTQKGGN